MQKRGRPRKALVFSCDDYNKRYIVQRGTHKAGTSYEYAWQKAIRLYNALIALDCNVAAPLEDNKGLLAGYEDYIRLGEEAKAYHELTGHVFDCMLHPQFKGLEGCKVYADGETFYVTLRGNYAPIHTMTSHKAIKIGKRLAKEHYETIRVLERA